MLLVICDYDKYRRYQETKVHEEFGVNRVHVNKPGTKRCGVMIYQCECGVMDYRCRWIPNPKVHRSHMRRHRKINYDSRIEAIIVGDLFPNLEG